MSKRGLTAAVVIAGAALMLSNGAKAEGVYPDWGGQWERFVIPGIPGQPSHDQTKPWGFGQQAPLTPEYRQVLENSIAEQAIGGPGDFPPPLGRPRRGAFLLDAFWHVG